MRHANLAAIAAAACLLVPGLAMAENGCTEIGSLPYNITQPGKYCLTVDHSTDITSGSVINIGTHNVTLDCQQHTLSSTAVSPTANSSAIVAYNKHGVTIENCRIIGGFTYGINSGQNMSVYNQNYYNTFRNNYVAGPYYQGIVAQGSGIEVHGNTVYDIGGQAGKPSIGISVGGSNVGFKLQNVTNNTIIGTNSPDNVAMGIYSVNSIASLFRDNIITGASAETGNYGIRILAGSASTISNNRVQGDGSPTFIGISTPSAADYCHSNEIWSSTPTENCTAANNF